MAPQFTLFEKVEMFGALFGFLSLFLMLFIGWLWGRRRAKIHEESLSLREAQLRAITISTSKHFELALTEGGLAPNMLSSEVVIGVDRFKHFIASIQHLFGGELNTLTEVIVRARRESILRLKAQAAQGGYNALTNFRIETIDISPNKQNSPNIAVMASATAYRKAA